MVDDVVELLVAPARRLVLERDVHDTHLVSRLRACARQRALDARTLQPALQEGDGLFVVPLGLDDHALDVLATHAPSVCFFLHDGDARVALLALELPDLVVLGNRLVCRGKAQVVDALRRCLDELLDSLACGRRNGEKRDRVALVDALVEQLLAELVAVLSDALFETCEVVLDAGHVHLVGDDDARALGEVFGMDAVTFQPAAGAHGEFTGVLLIKAYHTDRGDFNRTKIIVPDSAHGTNPATAAMCGFQVINIPSGVDGCVDLDALRAAVGPDTAGLMLTNPNTVGIFDKNILEITKIIHDAGGLCYYDGANLNAVMGVVRPGDMGFDCIHSNLHKTFATPHGGGGPGAGAVGCKEFLKKYMPGPLVVKKDGKYGFAYPEKSIGRVKMFYGNFDVVVRALTYVLTLGKSGIREAAMNAVLNANYMRVRLKDTFTMAYDEICMHEFVMSLVDLHKETGVSALDLAKGMLDFGLHPPTMYFPLIVHEALMIEPCETESKETMDEVCGIYCKLFELAHSDPETLHTAPHSTPVRRLDEVGAARNMVLRYQFA